MSAELDRWALVGAGNIGNEILRQVAQPEIAERFRLQPKPVYVVNSKGIWEPDPVLETPSGFQDLDDIDDEHFPDYHFVALPSTEAGGLVAMEYISRVLQRGKIAITAEKSALANNFEELRNTSGNFARLGVDATVGGGTRIVEAIRVLTKKDPRNMTQLHAVLNGTLTYMLSEIGPRSMGGGITHGQAVEQAVKLGFAEPGNNSFDEVMRGEAEGDIPKKTAILFNRLGLSGENLLDWHELEFNLSDADIRRVLREVRSRRFIVSIFSKHFFEEVHTEELDIISGFDVTHNGYQLVGGFQSVDHSPLGVLGQLTGPYNGALVGLGPNETDGLHQVGTGPGAGASTTVNTMLDNYADLRDKLEEQEAA